MLGIDGNASCVELDRFRTGCFRRSIFDVLHGVLYVVLAALMPCFNDREFQFDCVLIRIKKRVEIEQLLSLFLAPPQNPYLLHVPLSRLIVDQRSFVIGVCTFVQRLG